MVECAPLRLDIPTWEIQLQGSTQKPAELGERSHPPSGPWAGAIRAAQSLSVCLSLVFPPAVSEYLWNCSLILLPSELLGCCVGRGRARVLDYSSQISSHSPCQTELSQLTRWTRFLLSAQPTAVAGNRAPASTGSST